MDEATRNQLLIKYRDKLTKLLHGDDLEQNHIQADKALLELLADLGFAELVKLYEEIPMYW